MDIAIRLLLGLYAFVFFTLADRWSGGGNGWRGNAPAIGQVGWKGRPVWWAGLLALPGFYAVGGSLGVLVLASWFLWRQTATRAFGGNLLNPGPDQRTGTYIRHLLPLIIPAALVASRFVSWMPRDWAAVPWPLILAFTFASFAFSYFATFMAIAAYDGERTTAKNEVKRGWLFGLLFSPALALAAVMPPPLLVWLQS